jgi:hypothetical protein
MAKDPYTKHLRIGVRYVNGQFQQLSGEGLPRLKDGTVAEIVVAEFGFAEFREKSPFIREQTTQLLPMNTAIMIELATSGIDVSRLNELYSPSDLGILAPGRFAEVVLLEPLKLRIRGDQQATLAPAQCRIPIISKDARSVNHAFTLLSMEFETNRISHTGNVFEKAHVAQPQRRWITLGDLRIDAIRGTLKGGS